MTKWKDMTAGGHKIRWREEIKEGERKGWFMGEIGVRNDYSIFRAWTPEGTTHLGIPELDLVPAEPEVEYSGWINIYPNTTSGIFTSKKDATLGEVFGRIRIDWLSDGTYTVTKEEV